MNPLQLMFVGLLMVLVGNPIDSNGQPARNDEQTTWQGEGQPPAHNGEQTPWQNEGQPPAHNEGQSSWQGGEQSPWQGGEPSVIDNSVIRECVCEAKTIVNEAYQKTRENLKHCLKNKALDMRDLRNYANQARGKTRDAARAADCLEVSLQILEKKIRPVQQASETIKDLLTKEQWDLISQLTGCQPVHIPKECKESPFRTIDGKCNNRKNPSFGAANMPFRRLIPARYEDYRSVPVGWSKEKLVNGYILPGAREVSNHICLIVKKNIVLDKNVNLMFMQFGQQIDHDLTLSVPSPTQSPFCDNVDCQTSCLQKDSCFPIPIPMYDPQFKDQSDCLPFTRTAAACNLECDTRQQINGLTSFVDASFLYGSDQRTAQLLRNLTSNLGLLNVNKQFRDGDHSYLPFNPDGADACSTKQGVADPFSCFFAGDTRVSEQAGISAMQTLFSREHNRIATALHKKNPSWSGDILYEVSRKIMGAIMQHITYEHWLPILLGPKMHEVIPPNSCYDECVDATVANSFTIGFRMGHVLIQKYIYRYDSDYQPLPPQPLYETFFSPEALLRKDGCDPLIRGLMLTPAKEKLPDQLMTDQLRERLYENVGRIPQDLCSLNIQRSRDHGLAAYCQWRRYFNLSVPTNEYEFGKLIGNQEVARKILKLYGICDNIDLWLGAVSEKPVPGGVVGETLFHIIGDQFKHTKIGDRYFYTNCGVFTPAQLKAIKQASLSSIICANSNIDKVPANSFMVTKLEDLKKCSEFPPLDLEPWRGFDPYSHGESYSCGQSNGCGVSNCFGK